MLDLDLDQSANYNTAPQSLTAYNWFGIVLISLIQQVTFYYRI